MDKTFTEANISISLGLIVTELVINALKHAFPKHRKGKITVDYHATGKDWTLQVCDDGIGMPTEEIDVKPGLGTGIVEALSNQLDAQITVTDAMPGTNVSITHRDHVAEIDRTAA
ncbi:Blue-light-activated histidine kinase 2 [compost metagenome]